MTLSLFGGKKHLHHFVAEQDVAKELFALLVEAKTMYLRDVVTGNKQYYRYVEDFVNSHRYIDCDHAVCRNCHEMNIHIVKGLLNDCSHLIRVVTLKHLQLPVKSMYWSLLCPTIHFQLGNEQEQPRLPTNLRLDR